MPLTLDPVLEARIQRELIHGHYRAPSDVIAHALDLVEAEREDLAHYQLPPAVAEDWLVKNRESIDRALDDSMAQAGRADYYSGEDALRMLNDRHATRNA